jgi:quercetin dioxygenase-like cupin family protein
MSKLTTPSAQLIHRPAETGVMYHGPGDRYRFLVTGEETAGAYFAMEALLPQGGGPPPHTHANEDETFYIVEGLVDFRLGDEYITAGPGDFVSVPRGEVHNFHNSRPETAQLILTFTPAGIERFFEETLERLHDPAAPLAGNVDEVAARYVAAAPRYGLEFI